MLFTPPVPAQPMEMVLWSIVTAPVFAKALPQSIVAPVSSVMLVPARIVPANDEVVPRVAEMGISHNTWAPGTVPSTLTVEPDAVVSEDPNWKIQESVAEPVPWRVSDPVKLVPAKL